MPQSEDMGETCIFEGSKVEIRLHPSSEVLKQNLSLPNDTVKSDFLQVKLIEAWLKVPKGVEFDSNIQPVLSQQLVILQSSQVMTKFTTRMLYGLIFCRKTSVNLPAKPVWHSLALLPSTKLQHMDLFLLVMQVCPNHNVALLVLQVLLHWSVIGVVIAVILHVGGALAFKFNVTHGTGSNSRTTKKLQQQGL